MSRRRSASAAMATPAGGRARTGRCRRRTAAGPRSRRAGPRAGRRCRRQGRGARRPRRCRRRRWRGRRGRRWQACRRGRRSRRRRVVVGELEHVEAGVGQGARRGGGGAIDVLLVQRRRGAAVGDGRLVVGDPRSAPRKSSIVEPNGYSRPSTRIAAGRSRSRRCRRRRGAWLRSPPTVCGSARRAARRRRCRARDARSRPRPPTARRRRRARRRRWRRRRERRALLLGARRRLQERVVRLHYPAGHRPGLALAYRLTVGARDRHHAAHRAGQEGLVGAMQIDRPQRLLGDLIPRGRSSSSMTLRRVMPSSSPTDTGGVETRPPRTMKKLDELPSVIGRRCPQDGLVGVALARLGDGHDAAR